MLDASFSVEGSSAITAHSVAYGATVDLVALSTEFRTIAWEIVSSSKSGVSTPTITLAGTPTGATASFPQVADPGDGLGRSWIVKCTQTDSQGNADVEYRIVGTANINGIVPICADEAAYRNATHGWCEVVNSILAQAVINTSDTIATYAADITLQLSDAGKYLRLTEATQAVTVPANATVAFSIGTLITGIGTASKISFTAAGGVTVNKPATVNLATREAYSAFALKKVATNEWDLTGDLEEA